ncbi:Signal transduction histidine kinase [Hyunsoonleella jejuensis]|uniref:histidine kinase n=1 Tax=Hyunsoonleella jejuensis TaxID=419940 RepID=A0A1H9IZT7_9FLAO|nr:two-component regulator propeller domain-containing protein [Hyunsoonleella jejuensis]SEQ79997.1 Signal transduction histidine kinase [Hyunsoonleella jejuensis]
MSFFYFEAQNRVEFQKLIGDNSISQSITYDVAQDSVGNVWVASEEGVLKHDSKEFSIYNSYKGLPETISNWIKEIFIDSRNNVWIGAENGVCKYDKKKDKFSLIKSEIGVNPSLVEAIGEDADGNLWVGAFNGLWKSSTASEDLQLILDNYIIQAFHIDKNRIVFGTTTGLFVYNFKSESVRQIELPVDEQDVLTIKKISNGYLVGTKSGDLLKIDLGLLYPELVKLDVNIIRPIRDLVITKTKNIYLGIDGQGLLLLNKDLEVINHFNEEVDGNKSISSNGIYDLEIGKNGILWIATYGGGVNFYDSNKLPFSQIVHQTNTKNSIASNFTRSIAKDAKGNIWFGTRQGLSIWNIKKNTWQHIGNLSKSNETEKSIILALEPDDDYMWVGTYNNGLFKVNIHTLSITNLNKTYNTKDFLNQIYAVLKDSKNNIWFGGIRGNLGVIKANGKYETYPISEIRSIIESKTGHIYAVGRRGVYKINNENKKEFILLENLNPEKENLPFSTINGINEKSDGTLVLATSGAGLVYYSPEENEIHKLTMRTGLPSDIVQGLLPQNDSTLWASTTKGLTQIITTGTDTIINIFDKKDGLASTEYNYGSFERLNDTLFAFGGVDGVTMFNPNNIKGKSYKPIIEFEEFKLFNKKVEPGELPLSQHINETNTIDLKSNENSIEIRFIGVLQNAASKIKYTWKLEGFSESWSIPSTTNFATFTNLNSGEYNFRVRASNGYGEYGQERVLKISIASPWWATSEAFVIYAILIILGIVTIVYITSVIVKKKNADDQIQFFNNITHEIKTPLAILLSSLENITVSSDTNVKSKKRIKSTVKRINSLFEQMLNFHRVSSQDFKSQDVTAIDLNSHIKQLIKDFNPLIKEHNLNLEIINKWGKEPFYFDIGVLDKIILNLLSNAIKYSNDNGNIYVSLKKGKLNSLKIEVKDEGLGIPKDQQKYILNRYYRARNVINSQRPGTGLGLIMVKRLVEKTKGSIKFESEESKGTVFTVILKSFRFEYENSRANNTSPKQNKVENEDTSEIHEFSDSKILIVEDNDELREELVNTLGTYFQTFEAKNGKEGLDVASQVFPDLILTDLIMPEMDGMEMSQILKDDINLNHIPVFMLTVLQNSMQKIESLKSGITEYIEKPVDVDLLLAKMANVLKWQKQLRKKYVHETDIENANIFRNENDQEFIKKLEEVIIKNLGDSAFSVHNLASEVGMSRTSLYMKLKNLVDLSPQDFIINAKLKFAKNLIIQGKKSIKEVAYSSGFSNPKYFSTSFKKFYGTTPTGYIDDLKKSKNP